ncbi:hypothetical protein BJ973_008841 [Actinoplanes tereljensis]|uniref:Uncharacterized protein n=1 Tax=Paractinoplanes tereljensis TaxID=571912 RepID=A0A919NGI3_9ACTN|nr:hypothetical protein [Actinoplanes tereljensis]GIF18196.1 hypothetical protein Ate02nite_09260 [Actinoplanes tereljensis]
MNVTILHRLALGVEPFDTLTGRRIGSAELIVEREKDYGRRPLDPYEPVPPGLPLEPSLGGRFRLRYGPQVVSPVRIRLWDRRRRFAPRRFEIPLWTLKEITDLERTGTDLPVFSRVFRPWLMPGVAAPIPPAATAARGRIVRAGRPVPWARIVASEAGQPDVHASADERGEFLLVVAGPRRIAVGRLDLDLVVLADPAIGPVAEAAHRFDSLPLEKVARSSNPAANAELDNPLLRGIRPPATFVAGQTVHRVRLAVGRPAPEINTLEFDPQ